MRVPVVEVEAMVAALTTTGNHPIGESPASGAADGTQTGSAPDTVGPVAPGPAQQPGSGNWSVFRIVIIALIVGLILFRAMRAMNRQGGRR